MGIRIVDNHKGYVQKDDIFNKNSHNIWGEGDAWS